MWEIWRGTRRFVIQTFDSFSLNNGLNGIRVMYIIELLIKSKAVYRIYSNQHRRQTHS